MILSFETRIFRMDDFEIFHSERSKEPIKLDWVLYSVQDAFFMPR